jgi:hypothetical protein
VIRKDRGADVAGAGAGFDTVIEIVAAVCNSFAGTFTVMVVAVMVVGVKMFDPKFTTAPVAKLLPVIVRYVKSVPPVIARGGDN